MDTCSRHATTSYFSHYLTQAERHQQDLSSLPSFWEWTFFCVKRVQYLILRFYAQLKGCVRQIVLPNVTSVPIKRKTLPNERLLM